jgi:hypothetical protein
MKWRTGIKPEFPNKKGKSTVQSLVKVWGYSSRRKRSFGNGWKTSMVSRLRLQWGLGSSKGAKGRIVARKDALTIMINVIIINLGSQRCFLHG